MIDEVKRTHKIFKEEPNDSMDKYTRFLTLDKGKIITTFMGVSEMPIKNFKRTVICIKEKEKIYKVISVMTSKKDGSIMVSFNYCKEKEAFIFQHRHKYKAGAQKIRKSQITRKSVLKFFGASLVVFFIISTALVPNENNELSKPSVQNNKIKPNEETNKNFLTDIDYKIIKVDDISYKEVKRYNIKVVISNNPATKAQVKAISNKIINDYRIKEKADAVSILYYFNKDQVDGAYTLAKVEWAPNGDWEQSDLKKNQKTTYQFTNFIDQVRKNEPTVLEREINQAMKDKWYELSENNSDITDEDVAKILAPKYNKTVAEMLEIRRKVNNYDLGI